MSDPYTSMPKCNDVPSRPDILHKRALRYFACARYVTLYLNNSSFYQYQSLEYNEDLALLDKTRLGTWKFTEPNCWMGDNFIVAFNQLRYPLHWYKECLADVCVHTSIAQEQTRE